MLSTSDFPRGGGCLDSKINPKMIVCNYVAGGLNVEEVGGRRESQSPKALSPGHRPGSGERVVRPVRANALI